MVDLGCGPGADLIRYAAAVGPAGVVIGVDHDDTAVAHARQQTADLPQVQVRHGDVQALDLLGGSFDAAHADRVLQHIADPAGALLEAARVLKPGGRTVIAEPDWRTLVIDHPDPRLPDAFTRYVNEHQIRNPRLGTQLARLCTDAGLHIDTVIPVTSVFDNLAAADQVLGFHRVTQRVIDQGLMSREDGQRWLQHLAAGPVFASLTLFMVVASKKTATPRSVVR